MGLDWQIAIAQAVNLFVLVWILAKFLYKPIINAMNAREQRIAKNIKEAKELSEQALAEKQVFQDKNEQLDKESEALRVKMREEIDALRKKMSDEVKEEVDKMRKNLKIELDNERRSLVTDSKRLAASGFASFASKAIKELADETLEDRIAAMFVAKLEKLSSDDVAKLSKAVGDSNNVAIRSSFELSLATKEKVIAAVKKASGNDKINVEAKVSDSVICGIELDAGSWSVVWSLDSYFGKFSEDLDAALDALTADMVKGVAA